jgi:hypothetical protein
VHHGGAANKDAAEMCAGTNAVRILILIAYITVHPLATAPVLDTENPWLKSYNFDIIFHPSSIPRQGRVVHA